MTIRTPSHSIFRPRQGIDQGVLRENRRLIETIDRRNVLRGALREYVAARVKTRAAAPMLF